MSDDKRLADCMMDPIGVGRSALTVFSALDRFVRGSPNARAKEKVLKELTLAAASIVAPDDASTQENFATTVHHHLKFPGEVPAGAANITDALELHWRSELACLFQPLALDPGNNAITNLGAECDLDRLVDLLVRRLPEVIGLYAREVEPLHLLATEVRANLQSCSLARQNAEEGTAALLVRRRFGEQALQVAAFVQLVGVDVPTVVVENGSSAAITEVQVACWLQSYVRSHATAVVGSNIPFLFVEEIEPHSAWAWPFGGPGWADPTRVRTQLHTYFRDASGRRWVSAHDALRPLDDED